MTKVVPSKAIDRLYVFIGYLKKRGVVKSVNSFEEACGLSNKYVSNSRKAGKGAIGSDVMARIYARFPMLSLPWLCAGEGEMIDKGKSLNEDYRKAYESANQQIQSLMTIISKLSSDGKNAIPT